MDVLLSFLIETFKCKSCGKMFNTTRNKLSIDLECADSKCYGIMYPIKDK